MDGCISLPTFIFRTRLTAKLLQKHPVKDSRKKPPAPPRQNYTPKLPRGKGVFFDGFIFIFYVIAGTLAKSMDAGRAEVIAHLEEKEMRPVPTCLKSFF
jgi:hypothetical protein